MIPSLNFHPEAVSFDSQSPEGIGLQAGLYGGLLVCIVCACCCIRKYCIRAPARTDFIAEDVTQKNEYGSVERAARRIIHQRYESEIGHQPDTLSQRETSILEELDKEEGLIAEEDTDHKEYSHWSEEHTIHDGSEPDLLEISLTDGGESNAE